MSKKDFYKRVLFVIPYLANGGAERALSNIVMHFPEEWQIDILVNSDRRIDYPYKGRLLTLKIDENPRTASIFFQARAFWKRLKVLKKLKKENKYVACVSFLDSANVANILSGKKRCRVIVSVRSSLVNQARLLQYRYIVNPLVHLLYNKADKVVAVSKGSGIELEDIFQISASRISVIANGYDLDVLAQEAAQDIDKQLEASLEGKRIIVFVGRLSPEKGLIHLLRAFSRAAEQESNLVLLVVGDGDNKELLLQMVRNSNVKDKVYFTGYQRNPHKFVARSDLFVITSLYEGFPNVLAEAVCLGLPCIATDFQTGAREILAPALLTEPNEVTQMTQAEYGIITPLCSGKKYKDIAEPLEKAEEELVEAMLLLIQNKNMKEYYEAKSRQRGTAFAIRFTVDRWLQEIQG
ncbi:glycosyltransferase [Lachnospiraceae bacterium 54-11]